MTMISFWCSIRYFSTLKYSLQTYEADEYAGLIMPAGNYHVTAIALIRITLCKCMQRINKNSCQQAKCNLMSASRSIFLFFISITFFMACKKDATRVNTGKRLHQLVEGYGDSLYLITFHYDSNDRVTGFTTTNGTVNTGYNKETTLQYNAQGNVVARQDSTYDASTAQHYTFKDSLIYNGGRVIKKLVSNDDDRVFHTQETYYYNAQGNMVADTFYYQQPVGNEQRQYTNYTYDANGNIVQCDFFPKTIYMYVGAYTATYDTKQNVFSNFGNWTYFLGGIVNEQSWLLLSKNNVTSIDFGPGGGNLKSYYQYDYNPDGSIHQINGTGYSWGKQPWAITFSYE